MLEVLVMPKSINDYLDKVYEDERLDDKKKRFVNECSGPKGPMTEKELEEQATQAPQGGMMDRINGAVTKNIGSIVSKVAGAAGKLGMGSQFPGEVAAGMNAIKSGRVSRPWGMPEEIPESKKIREQETPAEKANELQPVPEGDIDDIMDDFEDEILDEQETPAEKANELQPVPDGGINDIMDELKDDITEQLGPVPKGNVDDEMDELDKQLGECDKIKEGAWDTIKKVGKAAIPVAAGAALGYGLGTGAVQNAIPAVSQGLSQAGHAAWGAAKASGAGLHGAVKSLLPKKSGSGAETTST
jgi:hypothetical protein